MAATALLRMMGCGVSHESVRGNSAVTARRGTVQNQHLMKRSAHSKRRPSEEFQFIEQRPQTSTTELVGTGFIQSTEQQPQQLNPATDSSIPTAGTAGPSGLERNVPSSTNSAITNVGAIAAPASTFAASASDSAVAQKKTENAQESAKYSSAAARTTPTATTPAAAPTTKPVEPGQKPISDIEPKTSSAAAAEPSKMNSVDSNHVTSGTGSGAAFGSESNQSEKPKPARRAALKSTTSSAIEVVRTPVRRLERQSLFTASDEDSSFDVVAAAGDDYASLNGSEQSFVVVRNRKIFAAWEAVAPQLDRANEGITLHSRPATIIGNSHNNSNVDGSLASLSVDRFVADDGEEPNAAAAASLCASGTFLPPIVRPRTQEQRSITATVNGRGPPRASVTVEELDNSSSSVIASRLREARSRHQPSVDDKLSKTYGGGGKNSRKSTAAARAPATPEKPGSAKEAAQNMAMTTPDATEKPRSATKMLAEPSPGVIEVSSEARTNNAQQQIKGGSTEGPSRSKPGIGPSDPDKIHSTIFVEPLLPQQPVQSSSNRFQRPPLPLPLSKIAAAENMLQNGSGMSDHSVFYSSSSSSAQHPSISGTQYPHPDEPKQASDRPSTAEQQNAQEQLAAEQQRKWKNFRQWSLPVSLRRKKPSLSGSGNYESSSSIPVSRTLSSEAAKARVKNGNEPMTEPQRLPRSKTIGAEPFPAVINGSGWRLQRLASRSRRQNESASPLRKSIDKSINKSIKTGIGSRTRDQPKLVATAVAEAVSKPTQVVAGIAVAGAGHVTANPTNHVSLLRSISRSFPVKNAGDLNSPQGSKQKMEDSLCSPPGSATAVPNNNSEDESEDVKEKALLDVQLIHMFFFNGFPDFLDDEDIS